MSEHEIPNNEAAILRVALDIADHRDVLKRLLSMSHMELEAAQAESLREICRLDALLWQTADEAAALSSDLDDLQAEWAEDASSKAAGLSLFSTELTTAQNRKHSELALADARIAELEALDRQQVAHVDELVAENERLSVANEHQRASLDRLDSLLLERTREYAAVHNELLEERRQKVSAFERNSELERKIQAAVNALQEIAANELLSGNVLGVLSYLRGPRAPSVPRRDTPGIEVDV